MSACLACSCTALRLKPCRRTAFNRAVPHALRSCRNSTADITTLQSAHLFLNHENLRRSLEEKVREYSIPAKTVMDFYDSPQFLDSGFSFHQAADTAQSTIQIAR